ncbi:hypothetical protein B0T24DRAFT_402511 [Lasiosphaeria ovina]|uniref:Uncharacterized protein n=1 Tax=Lasiosphaeria ovina TaxID=92902 RepID=A0AAE0JWT5_9PEZI|nr:hypothetical protein B0T24DRAFT_402511 [Lasiosphaeria ovina]
MRTGSQVSCPWPMPMGNPTTGKAMHAVDGELRLSRQQPFTRKYGRGPAMIAIHRRTDNRGGLRQRLFRETRWGARAARSRPCAAMCLPCLALPCLAFRSTVPTLQRGTQRAARMHLWTIHRVGRKLGNGEPRSQTKSPETLEARARARALVHTPASSENPARLGSWDGGEQCRVVRGCGCGCGSTETRCRSAKQTVQATTWHTHHTTPHQSDRQQFKRTTAKWLQQAKKRGNAQRQTPPPHNAWPCAQAHGELFRGRNTPCRTPDGVKHATLLSWGPGSWAAAASARLPWPRSGRWD